VTQPHAAMAPSDPIVRALDAVRARVLSNRDGEVASYIPELARADPEGFGLVVVSLGGNVYAAGECDVPFTIQSISKPFVLALALT
jgi:glutaminase